MKKLAIITTHPIQYNAPLFALLASDEKIEVKIFYTWGEEVLKQKFDPGFSKNIQWDIPLLSGYDYMFLKNTAKDKGSHHFRGIVNPNIINDIEGYSPDALLVYGWSFQSHLRVLHHYKNKIPLFFRGDSTLLDAQSGLKSQIRKLFLSWVYRYIDYAFFAGKSNRDYFLSFGLNENQLIFAPHAVDNERYSSNSETDLKLAADLRNKNGIPENALVFLFSGKLEPKKDPLLLLESFICAHHSDKAHLVFAGSGVLEKELIEKAGANPQIHFLGFINQQTMPAVYKMSDVLVLPSKGPGETWGLAVNEAMASGLAVLVSDKCGCAEDLVIQGKTGFVFASGNKKELTDHILNMINNRENLAVMSNNAKNHIRNYTLENLAMNIENAILKI